MTERSGTRVGMTVRQAATIEWSIIALCVAALLLIFQPFSIGLYGVGAGLVVLGGLAFNLVPLCRPGTPLRKVVLAGAIVLVCLAVVVALAIGSAMLYRMYLASS